MLDIIFNPWLDLALSVTGILFGLYILFFRRKESAERTMSRTVTENQLASLTKQPIMLSDFLEDRDAYLRMEKELLHKHHGEFVAIYDGKLIATDSDKLRLIQRVRKELGDERVFIQKVGESTLKIRLPQSRKLNIDRSVPEQK